MVSTRATGSQSNITKYIALTLMAMDSEILDTLSTIVQTTTARRSPIRPKRIATPMVSVTVATSAPILTVMASEILDFLTAPALSIIAHRPLILARRILTAMVLGIAAMLVSATR